MAFLGALESLLSARVADGMSDAPRHNPDRELFGQGLANIACGIGGGMPATGAIARTAVNARCGARTRVAALTHAAVLAAIMYAAAPLVGRVPLVALAGVLLVTAYRMVERHNVRSVLRSTRGDALVFLVTAVATVALNLVQAVGIGLGLAVVFALSRLSSSARAVAEPLERAPTGTRRRHRTSTAGRSRARLSPRRAAVLCGRQPIPDRPHRDQRRSGSHPAHERTTRPGRHRRPSRRRNRRRPTIARHHRAAQGPHAGTCPRSDVRRDYRLTHRRGHLFATMPEAIAHAQLHVRNAGRSAHPEHEKT